MVFIRMPCRPDYLVTMFILPQNFFMKEVCLAFDRLTLKDRFFLPKSSDFLLQVWSQRLILIIFQYHFNQWAKSIFKFCQPLFIIFLICFANLGNVVRNLDLTIIVVHLNLIQVFVQVRISLSSLKYQLGIILAIVPDYVIVLFLSIKSSSNLPCASLIPFIEWAGLNDLPLVSTKLSLCQFRPTVINGKQGRCNFPIIQFLMDTPNFKPLIP